MTLSLWRRAASPERLRADVVVIGAGVAGVSAALDLQRRGLRAIVLDSDRLAAGASGRNAGFLMRGCADNYLVAARTWGRERAHLLWRCTEENLEMLRAEGAADLPRHQRVPSCLLALDEEERAELAASVRMLRDDGFKAEWIDPASPRLAGAPIRDAVWAPGRPRAARPLGALVNPDDAACHPVELLHHLASKLDAPIRERQEVLSIDEDGSRLLVRTGDVVVEAAHALLCLNAYAPLVAPALRSVVRPTRAQMLALRWPAPAPALAMSYYANRGYEYFRQTTDGTIALGGARRAHAATEVGYEDRTTPEVQGDLERFAASILPEGAEIVGRWSGVMGFSPDGLPLVGPVPGWPTGRVWFCGGFTGHGMSLGMRTARGAVASMLDGADNPFPLARALPPTLGG